MDKLVNDMNEDQRTLESKMEVLGREKLESLHLGHKSVFLTALCEGMASGVLFALAFGVLFNLNSLFSHPFATGFLIGFPFGALKGMRGARRYNQKMTELKNK